MKRPRVAADIMVTRLLKLLPEANVFEGVARLLKDNVTGAPVVDRSGTYLGIFSERCCLGVLMAAARTAGVGPSAQLPPARDVMSTQLLTFTPEVDAFEAIGLLLERRISGASVVDEERRFLGIFSENTSMTVLLNAAHQQLPGGTVGAFLDPDRGRIVDEDKDLLALTQMFLETIYRRLPVLRDGKLVGQISRRDVLRVAYSLSASRSSWPDLWRSWFGEPNRSAESEQVSNYMDVSAPTISEGTDVLGMAQNFRLTSARRLPVIKDGKLLGQVSRRDLLQSIHDLMDVSSGRRENSLLYLSSLDRDDTSVR